MPGGSKAGGGLKTKKSSFYLKSGNSPLFKVMGSSPLKHPGHGAPRYHKHTPEEQKVHHKENWISAQSSSTKAEATAKYNKMYPKGYLGCQKGNCGGGGDKGGGFDVLVKDYIPSHQKTDIDIPKKKTKIKTEKIVTKKKEIITDKKKTTPKKKEVKHITLPIKVPSVKLETTTTPQILKTIEVPKKKKIVTKKKGGSRRGKGSQSHILVRGTGKGVGGFLRKTIRRIKSRKLIKKGRVG